MALASDDSAARRAATTRADFQSALEKLRDSRWGSADVQAIAKFVALARDLMDPIHLGELQVQHLQLAAEPEGYWAVPEIRQWQSARSNWNERVSQLKGDPSLRRAAWIVAEELWLGGPDVTAAVDLLDGVH